VGLSVCIFNCAASLFSLSIPPVEDTSSTTLKTDKAVERGLGHRMMLRATITNGPYFMSSEACNVLVDETDTIRRSRHPILMLLPTRLVYLLVSEGC
jgi:hypothetical protein